MLTLKRFSIAAGFVCSLCVTQAAAQHDVTLISNLAGPDQSSTAFGPGTTTQFKAAGFTLPLGDDYFLDSVTLQLSFATTGSAQVDIWSGGGAPSLPLITLDSPPQMGAGNFTFTPTAPFILSAGETYWAYVTAQPGSDNFNWIASSMAPVGIATSAGYNFNGNPSTFMNKYEVNGTVVPEPMTVTLLGLLGLAAIRRR
jgi:hypothetical protein